MFRFVKQIFISAMIFFGWNLSSVTPVKCISMNNKERKVRQEIVNVSSDEPGFFPFNIKKVNAVVAVIISMAYMQNCVFLML